MRRKLIYALVLLFTAGALFAQDNKNLDEVLSSKGENLLIMAIQGGTDDVKAQCIKALGDKDTASASAIHVIIQYSGYGVNYGMKKRFQDTSWIVRSEAALALGRLKAKEAVLNLIGVLREEKVTQVKAAIIRALGLIGDNRAVPVLIHQLRFAKEEYLIYETIIALGRIGDKAAFVELLAAAQDDKRTDLVRQEAIKSIDKIKW